MSSTEFEGGERGGTASHDPKRLVKNSLINGVAIVLPLLVTLVILGFVLNFVSNTLDPISTPLAGSLSVPGLPTKLVVEALTVAVLLVVIFVVGFYAEYGGSSVPVGEAFDEFMASLPGIGSVYTSFNEMSELLLDSDTESFQEVKLVEYPGAGSYVVAFKTAETPGVIETDTGQGEMETLFMPMAPNPVMGGFVIHVSTDRIVDVDMTVEQGIRSIVTSGVAFGEDDPRMQGLTRRELRELGEVERLTPQVDPGEAARTHRTGDDIEAGVRRDTYDADVAPRHADTPEKVVERAAGDDGPASADGTDVPPAEAAGRNREDDGSDGLAATPAELPDHDERSREPTTETPATAAGRGHEEADDGATGAGDGSRDRDQRGTDADGAPDDTADPGEDENRDGIDDAEGGDGTQDDGGTGTGNDATGERGPRDGA